MADHDGRDIETPEIEASGDGEYELDLDEHSATDLDEVIQEAVDAVDRDEPEGSREPARTDAAPVETGALQERLLRTLADFDNYRKRAEREKQTLRRMGISDVVKDFLGVIDNLERAVESSGNVEDLKQGLRLILRQQDELLRRHGVEQLESLGKPFDPTIHEAVAHQEGADVEQPTVAMELQKGYLLHDRLLRPAMVRVAMPARQAAADLGEPGAGESGETTSGEAEGAVDNG